MLYTQSLNQNVSFRRLYYRGQSVSGKILSVYYSKNRLGINRLGITVSGKIGKAVVRNKVRRRIKEAYRKLEPELGRGYDMVVVARRAAVEVDFAKICRELEKLTRNAKLIGRSVPGAEAGQDSAGKISPKAGGKGEQK